MTRLRRLTPTVLLLAAGMISAPASAQTAGTYTARLSPVPVDANTQAKTTGTGTVSATLRGSTLSVTGTFSGLQGPATTAKVHVGPRGIRGPAVLDLTVTKAASGTLQGELALTAAQVDHLKRSRLYIQLQSEAAPEGNLWGWLLP